MGDRTEVPGVAGPEVDPHAGGATVTFPLSGADFRLQVDSPQEEDQLDVRIADVARASAEIIGGGESESLLVLPSGIRIRNQSRSSADYRVSLPSSVHRVIVAIGERPDTGSRCLPRAQGGWTLQLGPP